MNPILRLSLPMTVWLIGFSALYALHGLSCSRHWPSGLEQRPVLVAAAALFLCVQTVLLWLTVRTPSASRFVQGTATALAAVAVAASVWTWAPLLGLGGCR